MFITLEGIDGAGKTELAKVLVEALAKKGLEAIYTKEPWSHLKNVLDVGGFTPRSELFLFLAGRVEHVQKVIYPALNKNQWIICDRFTDSTLVYQGISQELDRETLRGLNTIATGGICPFLTLLLDLNPLVAIERMGKRKGNSYRDKRSKDFFIEIREAYLDLAEEEPERIKIVDASKEPYEVYEQAMAIIEGKFHL